MGKRYFHLLELLDAGTDFNRRYNPFLRSDKIGVAIGFSDPTFRSHFKKKHGVEIEEDYHSAAAEWTGTVFPGISHSWEDVKWLQKQWDGPIVLKGIQTVADAQKCVELGVSDKSQIFLSPVYRTFSRSNA